MSFNEIKVSGKPIIFAAKNEVVQRIAISSEMWME